MVRLTYQVKNTCGVSCQLGHLSEGGIAPDDYLVLRVAMSTYQLIGTLGPCQVTHLEGGREGGREGGEEGGREGRREGGRGGEREGGEERGREGRREGGRGGEREGGDGGREGGDGGREGEGRREGRRVRGREGGEKKMAVKNIWNSYLKTVKNTAFNSGTNKTGLCHCGNEQCMPSKGQSRKVNHAFCLPEGIHFEDITPASYHA